MLRTSKLIQPSINDIIDRANKEKEVIGIDINTLVAREYQQKIKDIYSNLNLNLDDEIESKMKDFAGKFKREEKIKHSYGLGEFGLS